MIFDQKHLDRGEELVSLGLWEDELHVLLYNMYDDHDKIVPNVQLPIIEIEKLSMNHY